MTATQAGIYRGALPFEQGFTRIPNSWLRDSRISFKAKGLLAYLLSHEVGYTITLQQVERETGDGMSAIRSAMDELKQYGYLDTKPTRDHRGWNAGLIWTLQDPNNPDFENPNLENPTLDNQSALEENYIKKNKLKELYAQDELERSFDEFWKLYPRKVGKHAAKKSFLKALEDVELAVLMAGVQQLANDPNLPDKSYIKHPATWLNSGGWDDEPFPARVLSFTEKRAQAEREYQERQAKRDELQKAERARRDAEDKAREEELRRNPVRYCEHGRVAVMCLKCRNK